MTSVVRVLETVQNPCQESVQFLRFIPVVLKKINIWFWYVTTVLNSFWKTNNNRPENFQFFHENQQVFEVFEITSTHSSLVLIFFFKSLEPAVLLFEIFEKPELELITWLMLCCITTCLSAHVDILIKRSVQKDPWRT
jgi:hypothetical protein